MKLLNIPAHSTHILSVMTAVLRWVVSGHIIGSVGRNRHTKQFHIKITRHPLKTNYFAKLQLLFVPTQFRFLMCRSTPYGLVSPTRVTFTLSMLVLAK